MNEEKKIEEPNVIYEATVTVKFILFEGDKASIDVDVSTTRDKRLGNHEVLGILDMGKFFTTSKF